VHSLRLAKQILGTYHLLRSDTKELRQLRIRIRVLAPECRWKSQTIFGIARLLKPLFEQRLDPIAKQGAAVDGGHERRPRRQRSRGPAVGWRQSRWRFGVRYRPLIKRTRWRMARAHRRSCEFAVGSACYIAISLDRLLHSCPCGSPVHISTTIP